MTRIENRKIFNLSNWSLRESICQKAWRLIHFIETKISRNNPIKDEIITRKINVIIKRNMSIECVSTQPMRSELKIRIIFSLKQQKIIYSYNHSFEIDRYHSLVQIDPKELIFGWDIIYQLRETYLNRHMFDYKCLRLTKTIVNRIDYKLIWQ